MEIMAGPRYDYWPRYGPENYSFLLPLEAGFSSRPSTEWMLANWQHSITISVLYVVLIIMGRRWMHARQPFDLQGPLLAWNSGLAIFSFLGAVRNWPELAWAVRENGFLYSICVSSFAQGVSGFWSHLFGLSKVVELVDTAFIVLRKRPLTFLHCYHHCTVLVYTWHSYKNHTASGRWFIFVNFAVHALMYAYYAAMTLKWFRIPRRFSMFVTLCQLIQMVMGVWIGLAVLRLRGEERANCQQTQENLYLTFAIYFSYFLLFSNFFLQAYCRRRGIVDDGEKVEPLLARKLTTHNGAKGNDRESAGNGFALYHDGDGRTSLPLTRLRLRTTQKAIADEGNGNGNGTGIAAVGREPNHSG